MVIPPPPPPGLKFQVPGPWDHESRHLTSGHLENDHNT